MWGNRILGSSLEEVCLDSGLENGEWMSLEKKKKNRILV